MVQLSLVALMAVYCIIQVVSHPTAPLAQLESVPADLVQQSHGQTQIHFDGIYQIRNLSDWSRRVKQQFLTDLRNNAAVEWTVVMGNEGGDTDSMVSALAFAWHLSARGQKAVALLQTPEDALHLRKENIEALRWANMSAGHRDLLSEVDRFFPAPSEIALLHADTDET